MATATIIPRTFSADPGGDVELVTAPADPIVDLEATQALDISQILELLAD
ncbi:hypothetical protein ACFPJ4_06900 [Lysinimonas soli]|uniref:Uncharacterized protein n=1 Tax=Lysinimonas soli TaxID=1074233 RepID=A0ABW0NNF9_9MICO